MKKFLILSAACILVGRSQAQMLAGVGGGVHVLPYGKAGSVNFCGRFQLKEVGENNSISFGFNPALAFHYDSKAGEQTMLEVPLLFQFNTGFAATHRNSEGFGFFAGAGFGLHYITHQGLGYGPNFALGVRMKAGAPLEFRVGYHMDAFAVSADVVSASLCVLLNTGGGGY